MLGTQSKFHPLYPGHLSEVALSAAVQPPRTCNSLLCVLLLTLTLDPYISSKTICVHSLCCCLPDAAADALISHLASQQSQEYEGESIIIRTVCFIFRKTRAVDQTGVSEGVTSRLYRGCFSTSKFSFLRFPTVWAVSASVMDVDWRPVPSPCLTLLRPFLDLSLH